MHSRRPLDPDTRGFAEGSAWTFCISLLAWLCIGVAIAWAMLS